MCTCVCVGQRRLMQHNSDQTLVLVTIYALLDQCSPWLNASLSTQSDHLSTSIQKLSNGAILHQLSTSNMPPLCPILQSGIRLSHEIITIGDSPTTKDLNCHLLLHACTDSYRDTLGFHIYIYLKLDKFNHYHH